MIEELREVDPDDVCVSSVTYAELVHGVEKSAAVEKTGWYIRYLHQVKQMKRLLNRMMEIVTP